MLYYIFVLSFTIFCKNLKSEMLKQISGQLMSYTIDITIFTFNK